MIKCGTIGLWFFGILALISIMGLIWIGDIGHLFSKLLLTSILLSGVSVWVKTWPYIKD